MFAREAKSEAAIVDVLKDVILVPIDCEKGDGPKIAQDYGIRGYPTFIMINAKGEVLERWIGYPGAENWADYAAAGAADRRTIEQKAEAYKSEPTAILARSLGNNASTTSRYAEAVTYYRTARELQPSEAGQYTSDILMSMYYGLRGNAFTLDDVEAETRYVMASPDISAEGKVDAVYLVSHMARMKGERERVIPFLEQALEASATSTDEAVITTRLLLEIEYTLLVDKDTDKAVRLKKQSMPEGWLEDPDALNEFAWWCFENDLNLEEAEDMALRGVELATDPGSRADILDTAAEICNARGNCDEAIARIKQAIELDPDKGYLKEQLARFEQAKKDKEKG